MSDDAHKSKEQLIKELSDLRQRIAHLEAPEASIKQAQANFQDKENQIRQLYETIPLGYQSLDEDGRLLIVNQSWLDTLGYSQDEVIGRWFGDFLSLEDKHKFQKEFPQLKKNGYAQGIAFEMLCQDGKKIIIAIDGRVEYDAQGVIKQTHCILRDITPHIQAGKALNESYQRFNAVVSSLDVAIYVSDMETYEILFANQYLRDRFGDVEGKICWQTIQDDQTGPCAFCTNKFLVAADGQPNGVYAWEHQNPLDGNWYYVQDQAIPWVDGRLVRLEIATDITERKQVEASLQEMKNIVYRSGVIIFIWQAKENWPVEFVSPNIDQFGFTQEDFVTQRLQFANIVHPDDLDRVAAEVAQHSEAGVLEFDQEYRIITKIGQTRWIEDHTLVRRDQTGTITHYRGIVKDITERKESEAAWREGEARYRQMFEEHSSIQILVDPASQQIVDANPAAARFYGYKRERMRQMDVSNLNILSPEEIAAKLAQAKSQQRDYFKVPHRLPSGEIRQMEIHAGPISVKGRPLLYAILRDITDRIQAEEALRESSRELFVLSQAREVLNSSLDLDQVLTTVLDEVRSLLGVVACSIWLEDSVTGELVCRQVTEPQSQVVRGWRLKSGQGIAGWVAQNGQSLIVPDAQSDKRHFKGVDQQTKLKTRSLLCIPLQVKQQVIGVLQVMDSVDNRFKPADQSLVESLAATAAVAIENARLHERLADHAAEMERRVVERTRELVTANEQLKELDRLKTKLIEDISHELRTPVANLSLYLDLLERGQPEKQEHYKAVLREKMDQLIHLTEDVLNVFRLDLFKGDVIFERIDLNEIVAEVLASYRGEAQLANLDMRFEPEGNLPRVLGERKQVQQIVTSLVDNAINYTSVGRIHIKTCFDVEREQICLGVEDTGMGIASEELPYIFDRFYRGKHVGQLSVPGTGLGLAVVKDIVALHDGVVEVESVVDEGTIFRVWLPVGKDV